MRYVDSYLPRTLDYWVGCDLLNELAYNTPRESLQKALSTIMQPLDGSFLEDMEDYSATSEGYRKEIEDDGSFLITVHGLDDGTWRDSIYLMRLGDGWQKIHDSVNVGLQDALQDLRNEFYRVTRYWLRKATNYLKYCDEKYFPFADSPDFMRLADISIELENMKESDVKYDTLCSEFMEINDRLVESGFYRERFDIVASDEFVATPILWLETRGMGTREFEFFDAPRQVLCAVECAYSELGYIGAEPSEVRNSMIEIDPDYKYLDRKIHWRF